ncbi:hypothetical protein GCWU000341_02245 [Oribacterium sp. oral taxon 078 str. F0262]|nr:hypothetical protein GCWU000341_02245 [Oribacterium sp. oral taxon 078 str. F0262]
MSSPGIGIIGHHSTEKITGRAAQRRENWTGRRRRRDSLKAMPAPPRRTPLAGRL